MRYIFSLFFLLASTYASSEECKSPDVKAGLKRIVKNIPVSDITIITYKSLVPQIQWFGLYWEGPVSGALIAYSCDGKFLSGIKTGGIRMLRFFPGPKALQSSVAVEEVSTGTGYYHVRYAIYSVKNNRMKKVWEHTRLERVFVLPLEDGHVDNFEIFPSGPPHDDFGVKLRVEGVRKIYPAANKESLDFRVEKLATKYYCWNKPLTAYKQCK